MPLRIANFVAIGRPGVAGTDTVRPMQHQTSAVPIAIRFCHHRGAP
jgi:hypothetical protein